MIIPELDSFSLDGYFICEKCDREEQAIIMAPLEAKSLRNLARAMEGLAEAVELPECCGDPMRVIRILYGFDEPDCDPVEWDFDRKCLAVRGEEIHGEEQLHDLVGRPFSVADFHRMRLAAENPGIYSPSPGIVVIAIAGAQLGEEAVEEQMAGARDLLAEQRMEELGVAGPYSWHRMLGWRAWLGEPGDRIYNSELLVSSVISGAVIQESLELAARRRGITLTEEEDRLEIQVGEMRDNVDIDYMISLTVDFPLTVAEAASWVLSMHERALKCSQEAIDKLREDGVEITPIEEGMGILALEGDPDMSAEVNLVSISRKSDYDVDGTVEQISRMVDTVRSGAIDGTALGVERSCGCTPLMTLAVREEEWVKNYSGKERDLGPEAEMIYRPAWEGAAQVIVEDCPHSLSYVYRRSLAEEGKSEEQLFEEAQRNLVRTFFDVQSSALQAPDGSIHAVIWAGHNISTVMLDDDLLRGLDRQSPKVDKSIEGLNAVSITQDIVLLMDPDADQELVTIQLAKVRKALVGSPWSLDPMVHTEVFDRKGSRSGKFATSQLRV